MSVFKNSIIVLYFILSLFHVKLKRCSKKDILLIIIFISGAVFALSNYYPYIDSFAEKYNITAAIFLIGCFIGIFMELSKFHKEEFQFLYLQTYQLSILTLYLFLKTVLVLLITSALFVFSLLLYNQNPIEHIVSLYAVFIIGITLGSIASLFMYVPQKLKWAFMGVFVSVAFLIGRAAFPLLFFSLFIVLLLYFISIQNSWEKRLLNSESNKQKKKSKSTKYPVLKKEFLLILAPQRLVPVLFIFLLGQIVIYVAMQNSINIILIVTFIIVILLHDAWTISSIGLEEMTIFFYKYNHLSIKRLVLTKWLLVFVITFLLGSCVYTFWSIFSMDISLATVILNLIDLFIFNLVVSMTCILIGLKFTDFNSRSYYRITIYGQMIAGICLLIIVISFIFYKQFLLVELSFLILLFIGVFRDEQAVRRIINV